MGTWKSRGLRGSTMEEMINLSNEKYMEKVDENKEVEKVRENIILYDKTQNIKNENISFSSIT